MGERVPDVRMMEWAPKSPVNAYRRPTKGTKSGLAMRMKGLDEGTSSENEGTSNENEGTR